MAWNLSTGLGTKALLLGEAEGNALVVANTISFTHNTISDSASGLGVFSAGDWIRVRKSGSANDNLYLQCISVSDSQLVFADNSFTDEAAGSMVVLENMTRLPSLGRILQNGRLDIFTGVRPSSADEAESGTLLVSITKGGGAFTPGSPVNGINSSRLDGSILRRGIDPSTGVAEEWKGTAVATGTAGWARWYANDVVTGASTQAVRMDGSVTTVSGGDVVLAQGRDIVSGGTVTVSEITFNFGSCSG